MGRAEGRSWRDAVKNIEHHKALGNMDLYLDRDDDDKPWQYVTDCEPAGSHRTEIATSIRFKAVHPCGLTFDWCFDIEPWSANGKGQYEIDTAACRKVKGYLACSPKALKAFTDYLTECAEKVKAKGDEWMTYVGRQFRDAKILKQLAEEKVPNEHSQESPGPGQGAKGTEEKAKGKGR